MGLFDALKPKKPSLSSTQLESIRELKRMAGDPEYAPVFRELGQGIADALRPGRQAIDELPNARGPFGCATNPIPVASITSEHGAEEYLAQLKYFGGKLAFNRIGSVLQPEVIDRPVDVYDISYKSGGTHVGRIYLCPYFSRNSRKPPVGLEMRVQANEVPVAIKLGLGDDVTYIVCTNRLSGILGESMFEMLTPEEIPKAVRINNFQHGLSAAKQFLLEVYPKQIFPSNVDMIVDACLSPFSEKELREAREWIKERDSAYAASGFIYENRISG